MFCDEDDRFGDVVDTIVGFFVVFAVVDSEMGDLTTFFIFSLGGGEIRSFAGLMLIVLNTMGDGCRSEIGVLSLMLFFDDGDDDDDDASNGDEDEDGGGGGGGDDDDGNDDDASGFILV